MPSYVDDIIDEFAVSDEYLAELVPNFKQEAHAGLAEDALRALPMIPSFVTKMPNGTEKGLYLAVDLGGSNFRVCSVQLNGDRTHKINQMKWKVPHEVMVGNSAGFWNFVADHVVEFMTSAHPERKKESGIIPLGFCFSFPVKQTALNRGTLLRWSKGFDVKDAVGQDICIELQRALDERSMPVHVSALVNDTVGCLLSRSYATGSSAQTVIGVILGTGTNAAYTEKVSAIKKLTEYKHADVQSADMVINTEWGSFDNDVKFLPNTEIDREIDPETPNPTFHMFEKRVSGMFLGEIARRVIVRSFRRGELFDVTRCRIAENAEFLQPWMVDTSFLSLIAADRSKHLLIAKQELQKIGVVNVLQEELEAVKKICHAVALRSARLVAGIVAGLLDMIDAFDRYDIVDIGMDGSLFEFYPHYEQLMRDAWRALPTIGDKEQRITIGISKDGSGIGAALCAAVAH